MRTAKNFSLVGAIGITAALLLGGCASSDAPVQTQRASLEQQIATVEFLGLPEAPLATPMPVVEAPWGDEEGSYGRELVAAQTGPMAIAAELDGGVAVVDTVGARVYRYDAQGTLRGVVATGVETVDDIVTLSDGGVALLAYRRQPSPGYDLMTFDAGGRLQAHRAAPQSASLPTALLVADERLFVEHRHEFLHPHDGGERLWGRPAGDLLVRARLEEGDVVLWTTDRTGQTSWSLRIATPWPVTELLALESAEHSLAVVLRYVEQDTMGEPLGHQTWLVAVSHTGEAIGTLQLADSRITDASHPVALTPAGDVLELVTDEEGVTILRYERLGGAS